jgi:DNA-binding NarL/FixJ family response regulator
MKVVAEASDGAATVQRALELKPDVGVMDISMPGMNCLAATRTLKEKQPQAAIVTLTRHADDAYLQELLRAGVSGYVLKQSAPAELLQAIRAAAAGGQYLDSSLTARVTAVFLGKEGKKPTKSGAALSGGSRRAAADCVRIQQQGGAATCPQRQDRRSPQGQASEDRSERPHRHREVCSPQGWLDNT